jgi:hypothetical protein
MIHLSGQQPPKLDSLSCGRVGALKLGKSATRLQLLTEKRSIFLIDYFTPHPQPIRGPI